MYIKIRTMAHVFYNYSNIFDIRQTQARTNKAKNFFVALPYPSIPPSQSIRRAWHGNDVSLSRLRLERQAPRPRGGNRGLYVVAGVRRAYGGLRAQVGIPCRHILDDKNFLQRLDVRMHGVLVHPPGFICHDVVRDDGACRLRPLVSRERTHYPPHALRVLVHSVCAVYVGLHDRIIIVKRLLERRLPSQVH